MPINKLKREASALVVALNSMGPNYDMYPYGNPELKNKAMHFYQVGLISYNKITGLWRVGK